MKEQDTLYLLKPGFHDRGKTYFCPGCAEMAGLLEFYPAMKKDIQVRWVDFERPRPELVSLLGEENQSCPVLVVGSEPRNLPPHLKVQQANGRYFVEGAREIGEYLAHARGIGLPH